MSCLQGGKNYFSAVRDLKVLADRYDHMVMAQIFGGKRLMSKCFERSHRENPCAGSAKN